MNRSLLFPVLAALAATAACARPHPEAAAPAPSMEASVDRAATIVFPETFEAGGVVRARTTATIAARVTAPVERVLVGAGAPVRKGQPLIELEARELAAAAARATAGLAAATEAARAADAEVIAAQAALTLARATSDRVKSLFDRRSATSQEWDQASAARDGAEAHAAGARAGAAAAHAARDAAVAALRAADVALSYATITAPFDGVVAERLVDPGTMATAGTPLLVVEDPAALLLHVQVDEFRARSITPGQAVEARLDRGDGWTPARVAEIARVDPASHNFLLKIALPAGGARSGLFGRARFASGERRTLAVASTSVVRRGQLAFVFVVPPDGVARLRPVVVGDAAGPRVEILAGLSEGDGVVVTPPAALTDGTRVVIRP